MVYFFLYVKETPSSESYLISNIKCFGSIPREGEKVDLSFINDICGIVTVYEVKHVLMPNELEDTYSTSARVFVSLK